MHTCCNRSNQNSYRTYRGFPTPTVPVRQVYRYLSTNQATSSRSSPHKKIIGFPIWNLKIIPLSRVGVPLVYTKNCNTTRRNCNMPISPIHISISNLQFLSSDGGEGKGSHVFCINNSSIWNSLDRYSVKIILKTLQSGNHIVFEELPSISACCDP